MAYGKWQIANGFARGFTLIELLVSITVFAMLIAVIVLNLSTAQHTASLESATDTLLADLNHQQLKSMVGDTEGRSSSSDYGIAFTADGYTLFHDSYTQGESTNFSIVVPDIFTVTTTFPNDQIIFSRRSGEVVDFSESTNTITIEDTATSAKKTIELNRYGVVMGVN